MFRRIRENGPALLVPAAWTVVAGAALGAVSTHALFVAHVVMSVLLVAFVAVSWGEMETGVLATWRRVILAGTPVTLAGVAGFFLEVDMLLAVALYGWVLLPAAGFVSTARRVDAGSAVYLGGAACCVAGAGALLLADTSRAVAAALVLVGVGQTAGIVDATVRR